MANTSFGGTAIKKINIGTTQIKKVSVGDKLVYTSAEPFYIIEDGYCKQSLHFTRTAETNLTSYGKTFDFKVGDTRYQSIQVFYADATKSSGGTFVSDPIDTKGNNTFSYTASTINDGALYINGDREHYCSSKSGTFDISSFSSITLTIEQGAFPYNLPTWQPIEIRFF